MIQDEQLFFVLGYQKSGTTWVATMLRAHPEVHCDGEGHFHRGDDKRRYLPNVLASCTELGEWASEHSNLWVRGRDFQEEAEFLAASITRAVMHRAAAQAGKRLVGDKSGLVGPQAVASIYRMFPRTRILHIIRDPRDVAVSKCFHLWRGVSEGGHELPPEEEAIRRSYFNDPGAFGPRGKSLFHSGFLNAFADEWASWVPGCRDLAEALFGDRYLELRYEDLHADSETTLERILTFLGASVDPTVVRSCIEEAGFHRQSGRSPGELAPLSYFRRGIVGDWRNFFSSYDLETFENRAGLALECMGYARGLNLASSSA